MVVSLTNAVKPTNQALNTIGRRRELAFDGQRSWGPVEVGGTL